MAIDRVSGVSGVSGASGVGGYGSGGGKLQGVLSKTLEKAFDDLRLAVVQSDGRRGETAHSAISREDLENSVSEINNVLDKVNKRLSFRVHDGSERMMVYVIDNKTNEVVREVPPEKFLDVIARIREFVGLLIDVWL